MPTNTIKISQFPFAGFSTDDDLLTGLRDGANANFTNETNSYVQLPYVTVVGLTQPMAVNTGYVATNAGKTVLTLPALFDVGDVFEIVNFNGGWQIAQNDGQQIFVGIASSTAGMTGSIASTAIGDSIVLKGVVANTTLMAIPAPQGNISLI